MAELPRTFRVARQPTTAAPRGLPARPRIAEAAPIAATAALGGGLRDVGRLVADLGQAYDEAEIVVDAGEAIRQVDRIVVDAQREIEARGEQPRAFVEQFRTATDDAVQRVLDNLSPRARAAATGQVNAALRSAEKSLRDRGAQRFNAQAQETMQGVMAMYADEMARAEDPARRLEVESFAQTFLDGYTQTGLMTATRADQMMRAFRENTAIQEAEVAIQLDPDKTLTTLQNAESSLSGRLSAGNRAKLLDKAQQEVDGRVSREEAQEKRDAWNLAKRKNQLASQYMSRISEPGLSFDQLRQLRQQINAEATAMNLDLNQQGQLLRWVNSMWEARQNEQLAGNQRLIQMTAMAIETARSPNEVQQVESYIRSQAPYLGDALGPLLKRVNVRRDATSYTNQDMYHEGLDVFKRAAGVPLETTLMTITMQAQTDPIMAKLSEVIDVYRQTVEPIYTGVGGFLAGNQIAIQKAMELAEIYFPIPMKDIMLSLPPVAETYMDFTSEDTYLTKRQNLLDASLPTQVKFEIINAMNRRLKVVQQKEIDAAAKQAKDREQEKIRTQASETIDRRTRETILRGGVPSMRMQP